MMTEIDLHPRTNGYTNSAFVIEDNVKSSATNGINVKTVRSHDVDDNGEHDCGWFFWKPQWLQRCSNPKCVLVFMCFAAAIQGMAINGFVNTSISTIEKRYHLRSSTTGLIAGFYDVASVLCSIPVSYLGSRPGASKPRWLGWGLLIMGMGSFVFTIPHFAVSLYDPVHEATINNSTSICMISSPQMRACSMEGDKMLQSFKYIFILGSFLHGIGASPLYTLGIAYLDESVPVKMSSMYLGIYHTMSVIGPAIGYVAGGQFLSVFIDAPGSDPESLGVEQGGNLWLGAWWMGFLIAGSLAIIVSGIILSFPNELPGHENRAVSRAAASHLSDESHTFMDLKSFPQQSKALLSNWPFIFISLGESVEGFMMSGFATFIPKILESQFSVSSSFASILVGCITVPAGGGGTFLGGWLVKRFKLDCAGIMKMVSILSIICCIFCGAFFLSCPNNKFAGVTAPYQERSNKMAVNLTSECNLDCYCSELTYDPVCGSDKVLYFSPCHAGCTNSYEENGDEIFHECRCISSNDTRNSITGQNISLPRSSAIRESCGSTCNLLPYFLLLLFITMFFIFLVTMPSVSATLRSVHDSQRSVALGIQWIAIRVLGTIPGPIMFGVILDRTCNLWQATCDGSGACISYDNNEVSRSMLALAFGLRITTTACYLNAWRLFRTKVNPT